MRRRAAVLAIFVFVLSLSTAAAAGTRVPGDHWQRFADPAEAGFDAAKLEAARQVWEGLPSSAFLVIADGAVVAAWGDVERRFMCHSVRKSFLSALYGIYWDRGEIDLDKTLADLGIDDTPDPLLPSERQARILDLLRARSGVFHPAAYAGRTDSRPRGSEGPGRYWAYNNWDFNTLATILEEETGDRVFEAWDEHFARPLGMEDWRLSDGYYHFQRDLSRFPAYPMRLSARDAARFGLLFARDGRWGDRQILSRHWVRHSSTLYSIDTETMGYGLMWWVPREERFARHGMFAALGVGNQMIAALPDSDLVIVNRANTYEGQGTPSPALMDLIDQILQARTGTPAASPRLLPLEPGPAAPGATSVPPERLTELVGTWPYPPPPLGLPAVGSYEIRAEGGHLVSTAPFEGTFALYLQPDGSLLQEDSRERLVVVRDAAGAPAGIADAGAVVQAAVAAAGEGKPDRAKELIALAGSPTGNRVAGARVVLDLLVGDRAAAERAARSLAARTSPEEVEGAVNQTGYTFLQGGKPEVARTVFQFNSELFPGASNTWDSLGEAEAALGHTEAAIRAYEKALALNPENASAQAALAKLRAAVEGS